MVRTRDHNWARRTRDRFTPDRLVVLGLFVISRVAYSVAGVTFDVTGLDYSSQLLDPDLLRTDLFESVWYLHAQPPAFNLFVGLVLRWSPVAVDSAFRALFLLCGVVLILALHDLGCRLGLARWAAVAVAVVIGCGPTVVLFENWLSYEYPVATMLVVLVDLVARYAARPSTAALVSVTAVASVATLTRSLLHPVWLLAVFAIVVLYRWPPKRPTVLLATLPLVLVVAVIVKNQALFGTPQLSSWFGYSLNKAVVSPLTEAQRQQLRDEGIHAIESAPCAPQRADVPALSEKYKREWRGETGEAIENFNNECLIDKYADLETDAVTIARAHPTWYARNVGGAVEIAASPSSLNPFVYGNRNAIGGADDLYRRVVLLDTSWDPPIAIPTAWPVALSAPDRLFHVSITMVVAMIAATVAGMVNLLRWKRRTPRSLAYVVGGATVGFVVLSATLFEYGENNRIRFIIEPLALMLTAALVQAAIRGVRGRRDRLLSSTAVEGEYPSTRSSSSRS